jgi:hypothetical protein
VHQRIATVLAGGLLIVGLTGCYETFDDDNVYFENNTDQDLLITARIARGQTPQPIAAQTTTPVMLLPRDTCASDWLIYDSTGTTVVKDPGKICWHQTVAIP